MVDVKVGTKMVDDTPMKVFEVVLTFDICPLPDDKILDWSKLKQIADNKINLNKKIKTCFWKVRKHCGKRRKSYLPAFSLFPTMLSKGFLYRVIKSRDCVVKSEPKCLLMLSFI